MAIPYRKTVKDGLTTVTAFNVHSDNPVMTVTSRHPNYDAIVSALDAGDERAWKYFDVAGGLVRKFNKVTDRVTYDGHSIRFDGDVDDALVAQQILRLLESGQSNEAEAVAFFWEKLASNPNEHSREQAYAWLATHDFKITPEGDLVAYKGVQRDGEGYRSLSSGVAYVNGELRQGTIYQEIGDVVTMPRSEVQWDPSIGCHKGLHVGDWSYASTFGSVVLEVHVNPRNIVSVPTDCGARKLRSCEYKAVAEITAEYEGRAPVLTGAVTGWSGVGYEV